MRRQNQGKAHVDDREETERPTVEPNRQASRGSSVHEIQVSGGLIQPTEGVRQAQAEDDDGDLGDAKPTAQGMVPIATKKDDHGHRVDGVKPIRESLRKGYLIIKQESGGPGHTMPGHRTDGIQGPSDIDAQ